MLSRDDLMALMDFEPEFAAAGISSGNIYIRWALADAEPGPAGVVWALRTCAMNPSLELGPIWSACALKAADRIEAASRLFQRRIHG